MFAVHWLTDHRRSLTTILLIVLVVVAATNDYLHGAIERVFTAASVVIARHPVSGVVLFVILAALGAMVVFFSAAIIVPVAIYTWGRPVTVLLLCVGWLLGGALSYVVGRYPGRRFLRWLAPREKAAKYEKILRTNQGFALVALFQVSLMSEIPGYLLGSLKYPFWRYLAVLMVVEIPFSIGAVYLGESFLERNYPVLTALGAAAVTCSIVAMLLLRAQLKKAGAGPASSSPARTHKRA